MSKTRRAGTAGITTNLYRYGKRIIQVYVGDDPTPRYVDGDCIARSSAFFQKALNGNFSEKDGIVKLPHATTSLFVTYLQWLYGDGLGIKDLIVDAEHEDNALPQEKEIRPACHRLVELYAFGEEIQDDGFRNAVLDALLHLMHKHQVFPARIIHDVEVRLPQSSPLRQLLVMMWAAWSHPSWYECLEHDGMHEKLGQFWFDVMKERSRQDTSGVARYWPSFENRCDYHIHSNGERCI